MPDSNNTAPLSLSDAQAAEMRMRKALGLQAGGPALPAQQRPEQARQRHRFAQDGSVPVVVVNRGGDAESPGWRDRNAGLLSQLEAERAAHAATKRALQEAQTSHQALQTRLAHAELAHADALAAERRARQQAEEALLRQPEPPAPVPAPPPVPAKSPRKPRVAAVPEREAKPVKWWTPSYRAKARKERKGG